MVIKCIIAYKYIYDFPHFLSNFRILPRFRTHSNYRCRHQSRIQYDISRGSKPSQPRKHFYARSPRVGRPDNQFAQA